MRRMERQEAGKAGGRNKDAGGRRKATVRPCTLDVRPLPASFLRASSFAWSHSCAAASTVTESQTEEHTSHSS